MTDPLICYIWCAMDPINKNPSDVSIFLPAPAGSVTWTWRRHHGDADWKDTTAWATRKDGEMERWRFMVKIYIVLNILRLQKQLFLLGVARKNRSVFKIPVVFFQQGIWLREFTGKLREITRVEIWKTRFCQKYHVFLKYQNTFWFSTKKKWAKVP